MLTVLLALCAPACGRIAFQTPCSDSPGACGTDVGVGDAGADAAPVDAASDAMVDAGGPGIDDVITDPDGDGQPDLIAFYALDGCSPEDTWGAHDGAVVGTLTSEADRFATADGACRFPANAYVEVSFFADLASPTFSVSVWTRVDWAAISGFGSLYTWRDDNPVSGFNVFARNLAPTGRWELYFAPDPPNATGNPWNSDLFDGTQDDVWHHVAVTYDGTDAVLYLDGAEIARMTSNYNATHTRPLRIGMGTGSGGGTLYPFAGIIDEVALYDRALTAGEVAAIQTR
ncbi:MAG: LamG domain-containing protein [Sandaracinaceae bacterium]|nr:LamG domain-containing protein [Sandaracinaceae bacterium]